MKGHDEDLLYRMIGQRLRRARKQRAITQDVLGTAVGISRVSVVNIEKGRQRVPIHVLWALSEYLQIEACDLLPRSSDLSSATPESLLDVKTLKEIKKYTQGDPSAQRRVTEFIQSITNSTTEDNDGETGN